MVGEDNDNDAVPENFAYGFKPITIDRRGATDTAYPLISQGPPEMLQEVQIDPNDNDPNDPVPEPLQVVDADDDGIPDAAEPTICDWELQGDPQDGECNGDDDYVPPSIVTARIRSVFG